MFWRVVVALSAGVLASAEPEWTRFRGPNGTGVSAEKGLPAEISKDRGVLWRTATLKGNSSPIVVKGRVFVTGHEADERVLLCFDSASGKPLWRSGVAKARTEIPNPLNGPATPSPASDGEAVFAFFPEFGLVAYQLDGREKWRVPMGPFGGIQGMASSPIVVDGNVVLQIDTPETAYLAAFDARTGKQAWRTERPLGFLGSYATPSVYRPAHGPVQIVAAGSVELTGYQAQTGERLWWARGVTYAPANSPLIAGDSVYTLEPVGDAAPPFKGIAAQFDKDKNGTIELSEIAGEGVNVQIWRRILRSADANTGDNNGSVTEAEFLKAFDAGPSGGFVQTHLGGKGDVAKTHAGWRYTKGLPYVTAPVLYDGLLYVVRNGGILSVFRPDSGALVREERLKDALGEYYANPVAGDGKIYFINKEGKVTVIRAGEKWEVISSGALDEQVIATPAIAGHRIYIRTDQALYCFGPGA